MLEKLTQIIRENTGNNELVITEDSVLHTDLGINSLDLMNLVCVVEDEFDIEIPDRVVWKFKTVGDVVEYLKQ